MSNYDKLIKKQDKLIKKQKKTQLRRNLAEIKFKTKIKYYKQLIEEHRNNYYEALNVNDYN